MFARKVEGETIVRVLAFWLRFAFTSICLLSSSTLDDETIRIGLSFDSMSCGVDAARFGLLPLGFRMLTFLVCVVSRGYLAKQQGTPSNLEKKSLIVVDV